MSILDRLNLLIRSNINDSIGRHGRSSSARQALSEMETSLRDARRQQAELRRGERQLADQIRKARQQADQWEDRAMLAIRRGDEDLARQALIAKNEAMAEAQRYRDQLDDHRAYIQDIERALEALEIKLEGTRSKIRAVSGRQSTTVDSPRRQLQGGSKGRQADWDAEFERRMRDRGRSDSPRPNIPEREFPEKPFDTSSSFRELDRMASKIDSMEAEIEAMRELGGSSGDGRREELDRIFRSMEGRTRHGTSQERPRSNEPPLDDDLAELKKKFQ